MTEPTPITIRGLLSDMLVQLLRTNTLLERLVPDSATVPTDGLYGALRAALYSIFPPQNVGEEPEELSIADIVRQGIVGNAISPPIKELLDGSASELAAIRISSQASNTAVQALNSLFQTQFVIGSDTVTISEGMRIIREQVQAIDGESLSNFTQSTADNTLALLNAARTLVTTGEGSQVYTLAELVYALGVCQCEDFLGGDPPPPPPSSRPDCLDGVNSNPFEFVGQTAEFVGTAIVEFVEHNIYVITYDWPGALPDQGKSYTAIPGGGGGVFLPLRDGTLSWTGFADRFGVLYDDGLALPSWVGWVNWPYNRISVSGAELEGLMASWSSSQRVNTEFGLGCGNIGSIGEAADDDGSNPTTWRAMIVAVLPDNTGQESVRLPVIRVLASSGVD